MALFLLSPKYQLRLQLEERNNTLFTFFLLATHSRSLRLNYFWSCVGSEKRLITSSNYYYYFIAELLIDKRLIADYFNCLDGGFCWFLKLLLLIPNMVVALLNYGALLESIL
jgi:hypothetical protein